MENKISKQTIRSGVSIFLLDEKLDKDTIISKSEKWSDKEILFFKKCLDKGGALVLKEKNSILLFPNKSITKKVRLKEYSIMKRKDNS
jgi:hypothetical protein